MVFDRERISDSQTQNVLLDTSLEKVLKSL